MMTSERRHSLSKERKSCRARILRMLKKKKITLEELLVLYQEKNIFLFKGHEKELYITLLEGNAINMLIGNVQNWSSLHRKIIRRTVDREGCTLREFGERKLHKDVRVELDRMIQNEEEKNKKQEEQKTIPMPRKPWVIACRLDTDNLVHLVGIGLKTNKELLALSNRALCGQIVTRANILHFSNKATCRACLKEDVKRGTF